MLVPQFLPSHEGLSQTRWCVKLLLFVWQKFSIHFRLQSNPMVREKLALPLSSIARWFISNPMDRKILFWHFFPSHGSLYQSRWIGKSFFSKIHPSPKGVFQPRWLNRASGFHRPRNSLSVDGAKGRDQVWKEEDFHHGRNFLSVDGVYSQKWQVIIPSAQELFNPRCRGK